MASERPSLPLPRRPARRVVSASAGPSTSTPVQTHISRSSAALPHQSFTQEGSSSNTSDRSIIDSSRRRSSLRQHQHRTSSESPLILDLDQHNNSSIALSPRTAPRRLRTRSRRLYNDSNITNNGGDASLAPGGASNGTAADISGLPLGTATRSGRRIVSTPLQRQHVRHGPGGVFNDPSLVSASTASTSGILGNGSIVDHASSSPPQNGHSHLAGVDEMSRGGLEELAEEDEEEEYYSDSSSGEVTWELVDRMRVWRNDALNQHLYSTATFWGSKVFTKTRNPNDGFWLAQAYFAAGLYSRAERVLTGGWKVPVDDESETHEQEQAKDKGKQAEAQAENMTIDEEEPSLQEHDEPRSSGTARQAGVLYTNAPRTAASQASTLKANARKGHITFGKLSETNENGSTQPEKETKQIRLTDISVACRYLAAQAMVRQEKWSAAMDMLGEVNPFRSRRAGKGRFSNAGGRETGDGGIKFEASMCHLRGLVQLHLNAAERAKECFMEALSIDVKCYESFDALISGNMMDVNEEWNFVQGLQYKQHTPEDADFIRMMYTIRLRKYDHREEMERCGRALMDEYGLAEDPDVLCGLADELYCAMRYADCYQVTSKILETHDSHAAAFPLHLACMHHLPQLRSKLFLIAHELVDREPDSVISWYAVGLWYFSGKKWEESRRYFGKGLLLDNRFGPAWICFAHSFALEGEHEQAITAYSTAQRHFQGSHLPVMFIGMQYLQLANIAAAHEYLEASYAICQTDPLILNEMGVVNYYEENYEAAVGYFSAALHQAESMQASPAQWATTHLNMGQSYRKLKDYAKAITSFKRTLELNPQNSTAHSALGTCYLMIGESEEAILCFHEALAIYPGEPITTQLLRIALQDAVETQGRPAVSIKHSMRFPALSEVAAEDLDRRVVEDEFRYFGKALRIDESEEVPGGGRGGAGLDDGGKKKGRRSGRKGAGGAASSTSRTGARRGGPRQSASISLQQGTTIDLESSQDMSLQQSSPVNTAVSLPIAHNTSSTTYGYGGSSARRSTRASVVHSTYGTPHNGGHGNGNGAAAATRSDDFESQGENEEQDDDETERSYAGSDMVD